MPSLREVIAHIHTLTGKTIAATDDKLVLDHGTVEKLLGNKPMSIGEFYSRITQHIDNQQWDHKETIILSSCKEFQRGGYSSVGVNINWPHGILVEFNLKKQLVITQLNHALAYATFLTLTEKLAVDIFVKMMDYLKKMKYENRSSSCIPTLIGYSRSDGWELGYDRVYVYSEMVWSCHEIKKVVVWYENVHVGHIDK